MAFIVETGAIVANANSLTSVEFADTYHADRGNTAWVDLALERKQANLIKATDYFTGVLATSLVGYKVTAAQTLAFPRMLNYVNVGVPYTIQAGIAELALIANSQNLVPTMSRGKKRVKVGPIDIEYDGTSNSAPAFTAAMLKFVPWLKGTALSGSVRLQRV